MQEKAEQAGLMGIGFLGTVGPTLADTTQIWQAYTIIFSFFFIVIPTAVWACIRAWESIRHLKQRKDKDSCDV